VTKTLHRWLRRSIQLLADAAVSTDVVPNVASPYGMRLTSFNRHAP